MNDMLDSLANLLAGVMVAVLAVFLLNVFGRSAAEHIPVVTDVAGNAVHEIGGALGRIVHHSYGH